MKIGSYIPDKYIDKVSPRNNNFINTPRAREKLIKGGDYL